MARCNNASVNFFFRTEITLTVYVFSSVDRYVHIYDKHRMMVKLVGKGQFWCSLTQLFDQILLKLIFCCVIPYKVNIVYIIYIVLPQIGIFLQECPALQHYVVVIYLCMWSRNSNKALVSRWCSNLKIHNPF